MKRQKRLIVMSIMAMAWRDDENDELANQTHMAADLAPPVPFDMTRVTMINGAAAKRGI